MTDGAPDPRDPLDGLSGALEELAGEEGRFRLDEALDGETFKLASDRAGVLRLAALLVRSASTPKEPVTVEIPQDGDLYISAVECTGEAEPEHPQEEGQSKPWVTLIAGLFFLALIGVFLVGLATVVGWVIR